MIPEASVSRAFRGFRLIWMRPLLGVVLVPSTPMKDERLSTSLSWRITFLLTLGHRLERNTIRCF